MRKVLALAAVLLVAAPPLWTTASACGDKFLLIGLGRPLQSGLRGIYPATILLYAPSGRAASAAILDPRFQSSLTRAGHRVEVVKEEAQVGPLLQAGRFDLGPVRRGRRGASQGQGRSRGLATYGHASHVQPGQSGSRRDQGKVSVRPETVGSAGALPVEIHDEMPDAREGAGREKRVS